jgi:hypothetical protein
MKFKLLKLPDNDHINACIETFINEGINHPDVDKSFQYQEKVIVALVDHYGQCPEDIYCAHIHTQLLGLLQILAQYHGEPDESD